MKIILPKVFVLLLSIPLFLAGCGTSAKPEIAKELIGRDVTIQFRRDSLGGAADLPVPPLSGGINGAEVAISGKVHIIESNWVVLFRNEKLVWIPRGVILAIEERSKR
jgi:hypothetical protein